MGGVRWNLKGRYESLEDLPPTPIIRAGISIERDTSWHLYDRPKVDRSRRTECRLCWLYCPEGAIKATEEGPPSTMPTVRGVAYVLRSAR